MESRANCRQLLEPISDYISGEAADALCEEIEAHLAECENCRVTVDTITRTIALYRATSSGDLPEDVRTRLYRRLDLSEYLGEPTGRP